MRSGRLLTPFASASRIHTFSSTMRSSSFFRPSGVEYCARYCSGSSSSRSPSWRAVMASVPIRTSTASESLAALFAWAGEADADFFGAANGAPACVPTPTATSVETPSASTTIRPRFMPAPPTPSRSR